MNANVVTLIRPEDFQRRPRPDGGVDMVLVRGTIITEIERDRNGSTTTKFYGLFPDGTKFEMLAE